MRTTVLIPAAGLIIGIAVVAFLYGAVKYVGSAGDEQSRTEGRQFMTWGIIAIFVMVSVVGIVQILVNTFRLRGLNEGQLKAPKIPTSGYISEIHRG